jgi:L-lactate dehydrogenase complex protein LldG
LRREVGSKDEILENLGEVEVPRIKPYFVDSVEHILFRRRREQFVKMVKKAGGDINTISSRRVGDGLLNFFPDAKLTIDTTKGGSFELRAIKNIDLTILKAEFGVAENGAVWINWNENYPRALLTLSKNLAILLRKERILDNMAQAYENIEWEMVSYGVFLSGPSKTADIEQSLVIGAHGAMTTRIFLY